MKPAKPTQYACAPLLTIPEVAQRIRGSPRTVRRLIAAGEIIAIRVGVQLRIAEADLEHYVRRRRGK